MKQLFACLMLSTILISCTSNTKRILVIAKGSVDINTDAKTITFKDGAGTEEKTADFNSNEKLTLQLKKETGNLSVELADKGYYILNGKNDTIVGSYQKYGAPKSSYDTIKQEVIKKGIDSLSLLIEGKNVSTANRNYYILPNQAVKITDNIDATIIAPYHQMTSIEKTGDKEPEVYRFYSLKEVRETIQKLKALSAPIKK